MAAFTAALIGLALAGGLAAGKKLGEHQAVGDQSQDSSSKPGLAGQPPAPPPSLALVGGDNAAKARAAGQRTRKKAAGSLLDTPILAHPAGAQKNQPKTLLGY